MLYQEKGGDRRKKSRQQRQMNQNPQILRETVLVCAKPEPENHAKIAGENRGGFSTIVLPTVFPYSPILTQRS